MIELVIREAIMYACLLILMGLSITLVFVATRVFNFAVGSLVTIGLYVVLTGVKLWGGNPYFYTPLCFVVGSITGLALYKLLVGPLMRRGAGDITLMMATMGFDVALVAILNIYADYLSRVHKVMSRLFQLGGLDFNVLGNPGLSIVAPVTAFSLVVALYLFLTKTAFGTAIRATIENPFLTSLMGIDTELVYTVSFIIAGGLATLAGGLLSLRTQGNPDTGMSIIVSMFASSILGGLYSIYGPLPGGLLIGLTEILGMYSLSTQVGYWIISYRPMLPLIVMALTLLVIPRGLAGVWATFSARALPALRMRRRSERR